MKLFLLFISTFCFAYIITNNSYQPSNYRLREPSSVDSKDTRNSYTNIRCPSETEFKRWAVELNMEGIEGASLDAGCKNKSHKTQLAQVLSLMHELKFNLPDEWAPSVHDDFKNVYDYLKKNTNKLRIDLTQQSSVARNLTNVKTIELGGYFFKMEPLEAISILVHEARHSDSNDQGHTLCRIGDITKTDGGCDHYFSTDSKNAGAYSYGILVDFALGQYSPNLDNAEKEIAIASALETLGTRINHFQSVFAKYTDIITVLLNDGSLAWLHPYTLQLIPFNIQLPKFQEKIKKIEFLARNNFIMLYTESDRLFAWDPKKNIGNPLIKSTALPDDKFSHASLQYVPYDSSRTRYTTLRTNGTVEYIDYDTVTNKFKTYPYPLHKKQDDPNPKMPNLGYFFLAHGNNSYFIDRQGIINKAMRYGNEPNFLVYEDLQSNAGGWKIGTGGVFFDDLYLIDSTDKIRKFDLSINQAGGEENWKEVYTQSEANFQSEESPKKYQQGLQIHTILDETGGLAIENYRINNSKIYFKPSNKKIIDVVVTRITNAESKIYNQNDFNQELIKKCSISKVIGNIGYGSILGLTSDSLLVSAELSGACNEIIKNKKWNKAEIAGTDDSEGVNSPRQPFPDIYLKLSAQKENLKLAPYTRSSLDHNK